MRSSDNNSNTSLTNRGKKLFRGSAIRTVQVAIKILIAFFMLPFLINHLGDKTYGFWVIVMTVIDYYLLLRLGFSNAVTRYLTRAVGANREKKKLMIVSTAFYIYLFISALMLLTTFGLFFGCKLVIDEQQKLNLFRKLILILGFNTALSPPLSINPAILHSHFKFTLTESVNTLNVIFKNTLVFIVVSLGYGLVAIALVHLISNVLFSSLYYILRRVYFRYIKIKIRYFSKKQLKTLFHYSLHTFIAQLAETLRYRVDSFIIASYITLNAVTHYSIAFRIMSYFTLFIRKGVSLITPYFSQEEGRGDFDSIKEKFILTTKICSITVTYLGFSVILYGKPFIQRWMGPEYSDSYTVLLILTISTIFLLAQQPSISVLYGISKNKFLAYTNVIEGVFNLVISLILVKKYGLIGVALGTTIPMLLFQIIVQPLYVNKILQLNYFKYMKKLLFNILLTVFLVSVYYFIIKNYITISYFRIILIFTIQTAYFFGIIYCFFLNKKQKRYIKSLI